MAKIDFHKGDFYLGDERLGGNDDREWFYHTGHDIAGKYIPALRVHSSSNYLLQPEMAQAEKALRRLYEAIRNLPVAEGSEHTLKDIGDLPEDPAEYGLK